MKFLKSIIIFSLYSSSFALDAMINEPLAVKSNAKLQRQIDKAAFHGEQRAIIHRSIAEKKRTLGGRGLHCLGFFEMVGGVTFLALGASRYKDQTSEPYEYRKYFAGGLSMFALGIHHFWYKNNGNSRDWNITCLYGCGGWSRVKDWLLNKTIYQPDPVWSNARNYSCVKRR